MAEEKLSFNSYYELVLSSGMLPPPIFTPEVPLYRYRSNIDYALDEIKEQYVFSSPTNEQNDPFDSSYQMTYEEALKHRGKGTYFFTLFYSLPGYPHYKEVSQILHDVLDTEMTLEEFSVLLSEAFNKQGVPRSPESLSKAFYSKYLRIVPRRSVDRISCFSEKKDSIPMWAYYADGHTGLCFQYDFSLLDSQDRYHQCIVSSLHKVWYSNNKPKDLKGNYSYYVKAQDWSHEQEWRLINWTNDNRIDLPCMTEIYLGISFPFEKKLDSVIDAIRASGKHIKLFACQPNLQAYKIDFIRIHYSD